MGLYLSPAGHEDRDASVGPSAEAGNDFSSEKSADARLHAEDGMSYRLVEGERVKASGDVGRWFIELSGINTCKRTR